MNIKCDGDIPCPKYKRNPCCAFCKDFQKCNFEDKCVITPEECNHKDFTYEAKKD